MATAMRALGYKANPSALEWLLSGVEAAHVSGVTPEIVVKAMVEGLREPDVWPAAFRSAGVLAPPRLKPRLTLDDLWREAAPEAVADRGSPWAAWQARARVESGVFELLFPMRHRSDAGLRRTRHHEAYSVCDELCGVSVSDDVCATAYAYCWSYTFTLNVLWAAALHGQAWWTAVKPLVLRREAECVRLLRSVSDKVKTHECDFDRVWLLETHVLGGYMTPPSDFDIAKASVEWAHSGKPHSLYRTDFEAAAREALKMVVTPGGWKPLFDFVDGGSWVTAGSSSVGHVEFEVGEERGRFKARKNNVADVLTSDELFEIATTPGQSNIALPKAETAKVRLTVAGDLGTYLRMAWVSSIVGDAYKQWPGSTMQETLVDMSDRIALTLRGLRSGYGLSFDYRGYDHQALLDEVVAIVRVWLDAARTVVPADGLAEFDAVAEMTIRDFYSATLSWRQSATQPAQTRVAVRGAAVATVQERLPYPVGGDWPVVLADDGIDEAAFLAGARAPLDTIDAGEVLITGGLPSGLAITSLVGNAWNTVMTRCVLAGLAAAGVPLSDLGRWVRGDDTVVTAKTWAEAYLIVAAYAAQNIDFGVGKFSIWERCAEFLRQWYDAGAWRVSGYPNRAIVGLTQRKPWSNEPWTPDGVITALRSVLDTLARRGVEGRRINSAWEVVARRWCHVTRIDRRWLDAPRVCGGLGLTPGGRVWPTRPWPVLATRLRITNATDAQERRLRVLCQRAGVAAVDTRVSRVAAALRARRVVSDNVPQVASQLRREWREQLDGLRVEWRTLPTPRHAFVAATGLTALQADVGAVAAYVEVFAPPEFYGYLPAAQLEELRLVAECSGDSIAELLRRANPTAWYAVRTAELRGLRRAEALAWLTATVEWPVLLNPAAQQLVSTGAARLVGSPLSRRWHHGEWAELVVAAGTAAAADLASSAWYRMAMLW